jgi:hypothetical protein
VGKLSTDTVLPTLAVSTALSWAESTTIIVSRYSIHPHFLRPFCFFTYRPEYIISTASPSDDVLKCVEDIVLAKRADLQWQKEIQKTQLLKIVEVIVFALSLYA